MSGACGIVQFLFLFLPLMVGDVKVFLEVNVWYTYVESIEFFAYSVLIEKSVENDGYFEER